MNDQTTSAPAKKRKSMSGNDGGGLLWCLGVIGAAVYYIQQADTFGQGVLGILKAIVWPAILVYKLLQFLGM